MPQVLTPFPEFDEDEWGYIEHLEFANQIWQAGMQENVSMLLIAAVAEQESAWDEDVEGPPIYIKGEDGITRYYGKATGLMQIMPGTLTAIERRLGMALDPFDPGQSIRAGANELRFLKDYFGEQATMENVLAGYNAGPRHVEDSLAWGDRMGQGIDDPDYGVPNIDETHRYLGYGDHIGVPQRMHRMSTNATTISRGDSIQATSMAEATPTPTLAPTPLPSMAWEKSVQEESWWDKLGDWAQDKWKEITRPPIQESKRDKMLGSIDRYEKATGQSWRSRFRA